MIDPMTAISIGSTVAGLFGKKKKAKSVDAARPYHRPVNDTIGEIKKLEDYIGGATNYTERPMRQMTEDEMFDPVFKQNAVMDIKRYFDDQKVAETVAPTAPVVDYDKMGREYVDNYGRVANVNPTYWSGLIGKGNFDYAGIAKALMDTQNDGTKFNATNDFLLKQGLGYAPKGLPNGITMPKGGVAGYAQ